MTECHFYHRDIFVVCKQEMQGGVKGSDGKTRRKALKMAMWQQAGGGRIDVDALMTGVGFSANADAIDDGQSVLNSSGQGA